MSGRTKNPPAGTTRSRRRLSPIPEIPENTYGAVVGISAEARGRGAALSSLPALTSLPVPPAPPATTVHSTAAPSNATRPIGIQFRNAAYYGNRGKFNELINERVTELTNADVSAALVNAASTDMKSNTESNYMIMNIIHLAVSSGLNFRISADAVYNAFLNARRAKNKPVMENLLRFYRLKSYYHDISNKNLPMLELELMHPTNADSVSLLMEHLKQINRKGARGNVNARPFTRRIKKDFLKWPQDRIEESETAAKAFVKTAQREREAAAAAEDTRRRAAEAARREREVADAAAAAETARREREVAYIADLQKKRDVAAKLTELALWRYQHYLQREARMTFAPPGSFLKDFETIQKDSLQSIYLHYKRILDTLNQQLQSIQRRNRRNRRTRRHQRRSQ